MASLAIRDIVFIPVLLDDTEPPALIRDLVYFDLRSSVGAGVYEIVKFFLRETSRDGGQQQQQQQQQQQRQQQQQQQQQQMTLRVATRRQIRLVAKRCIDDGALRAFCLDTELDFGELAGISLHERLVSLLHRLDREQLLAHFAEWLESEKGRCVQAQIAALSREPGWLWQSGCLQQQQQQP